MKFPPSLDRIRKRIHTPSEQDATLHQHAEWEKKLVFSLAKSRFPTRQQWGYLPKYLTPKERGIVRMLAIITVAALVFVSVRYYQRHIEILPRPGGTYIEALVGQPQYINPILAQYNDTDMDLVRLLYAGLLRFNEHGNIVTDLAERYEISEDQKTYTIMIQPDLTWHDGEPITADDVIFTVQTIQDPTAKSPLANSFRGVTVERIDELTVAFTIKDPFAPFLSSLTFGILPVHIWGDVPPSAISLSEFNIRPIGSGPYQFDSLQKNKAGDIRSYTVSNFPGYHGEGSYISTITFKLFPDFESAVEAINNRTVQGLSFLPQSLKSELTTKDDIIPYAFRLPQYTAVFFYQKNALLKDLTIRKALTMSVDRDLIVSSVLGSQGMRSDGPIPPGYLGYAADIQGLAFDPDAARKLLDDAGWAHLEGKDIRTKGSTELKFTLTTVDQAEYVQTAELLQQYWRAINVGVEIVTIAQGSFDREVLKTKNYEALLYGELIGYDPDPFPFWHSSQVLGEGLNLSAYVNKDVDKLLADARATNASDVRSQKYIEFQRIIADDLPALFLFSPAYTYPVDEELQGIEADRVTVPADRFNGVTSWYLKTRRVWR